jgi:tetratricopeptide (TPR) repeat protein
MCPAAVFEERVLFSPNMPEAVNQLLQAAVAASHDDKPQAEKLFKQAQQLDSSCLQAYFALYKFYFYQGRLLEAEREVNAALHEAARQGGFPADYQSLAQQPGQWDLYASDTTLFYMYSLKALGFIKLRLDQLAEARIILSLLAVIDPEDRIGASVIMSLADALEEAEA